MKRFIKNYIDIINDMSVTTDEKIDVIIDTYDILKSKDKVKINEYIVKPLLQEYRETENNITLVDIEELFHNLLELL